MLGRSQRGGAAFIAAVCCVLVAPAHAAAPSVADRGQVKQAESALTRAGNFYRAKKYRESGDAAREAIGLVEALPADDSRAWQSLLEPLRKQLTRAKQLLATHGVEIPELSAPSAAPPAGLGASFTKDVTPILLSRCGNCHVQRARGEFSMASFAALAKGSPGGTVIMPGDAEGSRMIELVETGDMPRGGGKLSAEELTVLKSWINAGAKFDGDDEAASLASLAPSTTPATTKLEVVAAGAQDEVRFARDIGPILLNNCLECHGERNAGANFSMSTFSRLLQGGAAGPPFVPGKPADSLIIKKLRGTAGGARMPQGRDPLPEATIAKIEKWISLGGKLDGPDPGMALADVVAQNAASRMTHAELSKERVALSAKTWRLILPDVEANREESENVLVVGGVGKEVLAEVALTADEQVAKLRKLFKVPDNEPLIRGRLTLYVFDKRYDYGEVGTMLEHRELPLTWHGHWAYSPLEPYGCILLSDRGKAPPGLVAQQIAGVYVASLGNVPRWFSEGSARAIAARIDPKDPRVQQWDDRVAEVLATTDKPEGFLTEKLPPEDGDVLSYSFVSKLLMSPTTRYVALIARCRKACNSTKHSPSRIEALRPKPCQPGFPASAAAVARVREFPSYRAGD